MTNATPAVTIVFLLAAMAISSPAVAQAIPGPPMGLSTAVSGNDVSFRWTVTSGFPTGYVIEAGSAPGLADIATAHTGFFQQLVVTAVPPGNYFVRVRATNASGTSGPSNEVIVRVGAACQLPPAPVDLTSAVVGASVSLQWSGTGGSFQLEAGSGPGKSDIVNADIGTASSIEVPAPLGFYFVRVRERNSCGFGPPSDEIVVAVGVPDPPANFRASIIGDQVTFRWDALAPSPAGYALEAGSAPGATDVAVLPVGLAASYTAPGVPPGTYYVRLRAFDSAAGGAPSNELVVTVGAPSPWTETVTFSNLFPTDVPLVSYSELGYRVEAVSGPWITGSAIGFTRQAADPLTSGTIRVTANGNPFLFTSVDQYSSETSIPYVFTGLRNGVTVFTAAGTVPTTFGQYARVPNPFPWTVIDTLMITVSNPATPCCSNPVALDNIGLRSLVPPPVRVDGIVVDADSDSPVPGAVVKATTIFFVQGQSSVNNPAWSAVADATGGFGFAATHPPLGWRELALEVNRTGYERGTFWIEAATAASAVLRLVPILTIRPGESIQTRIVPGHGCFFESWQCRRIIVDSPSGDLIDIEVIPADSDALVGVEGPASTHPIFPSFSRRITVAGGEIWIYGAGEWVTVTATPR